MYVKVETDCAFAGCNEKHLVEVPDDMSEEELNAMVNEYVQADITPEGSYEILTEEEAEELAEDGYECESYGFEVEPDSDPNEVPGTGDED